MIKEFSKSKDGNLYISKNFKVNEFACKDGTDYILIDLDMIPVLQRFRQYVETSVSINSAYRTDSYNKKVGGASNSYHKKGKAFDIPFLSSYKYINSIDKMCDFFNTLGVHGIIKYSWGVHIDTRDIIYHANNSGNLLNYGKINIPLYNNLSIGNINNDVGILQFMLKYKFGININIDCNFGNNTYYAVKEFQKIKNLSIDGIVGQNTWKELIK